MTGKVKILKKIKRNKNSISKLYFHKGTQQAIEAYQRTDVLEIKQSIYTKDILPAFEKLVENLINIHKFTSIHDSYDDLKYDCMNFLFDTLGKFDPTRGTNAFSYFNVVAKNFLIIKTKQRNQRLKRIISLDDTEAMTTHDSKILEDIHIVPSCETVLEQSLNIDNIITYLYEVRATSKTENELLCINSIISLFENINNIDLLNKNAVLFYLREISGLKPKQLTTALQNIKKYYKRIKAEDVKRNTEC